MSHGGAGGLHLGHLFDKKQNAFSRNRELYQGDRHSIVFGPTGSGKFTRLLSVNLLSDCLDDRSVLVFDPKGEAAAVTAWHRHKTLGHDVKILDPFGALHTAIAHSPDRRHKLMIDAALREAWDSNRWMRSCQGRRRPPIALFSMKPHGSPTR